MCAFWQRSPLEQETAAHLLYLHGLLVLQIPVLVNRLHYELYLWRQQTPSQRVSDCQSSGMNYGTVWPPWALAELASSLPSAPSRSAPGSDSFPSFSRQGDLEPEDVKELANFTKPYVDHTALHVHLNNHPSQGWREPPLSLATKDPEGQHVAARRRKSGVAAQLSSTVATRRKELRTSWHWWARSRLGHRGRWGTGAAQLWRFLLQCPQLLTFFRCSFCFSLNSSIFLASSRRV